MATPMSGPQAMDPTISELLASAQRDLAESVRITREAVERLMFVNARVAALLAENAKLRGQLAREELRARGVIQ